MDERRSKKTFTLREAQELLPKVQEITRAPFREAEAIAAKIEDLNDEDDPVHRKLQKQYLDIVNGWANQVLKLGCEVKAPWLVDFDNGHGYFCWQHPEPDVEHFHGYEDGFAGRTKIM